MQISDDREDYEDAVEDTDDQVNKKEEEEPRRTMEPETAAEKAEFYRLLSIGAWPSDE